MGAQGEAKTSRISICLDGKLEDAVEAAEVALAECEDDSQRAALQAALGEANGALQAGKTEFVFQVGRGRWRKLQAEWPPTDEQKAAGAQFDTDEFPFVAMAEFLISPKMTVDELKRLDDDVLDEQKFSLLWGACIVGYWGKTRPPSVAELRLLNGLGSFVQHSGPAFLAGS